MNNHFKTVGAIGIVLASLLINDASSAASPPVRDAFVETWDYVDPNLCGLAIHIRGEESVRLLINGRGPNGLPHFGARLKGSNSFTNLATGKSYSSGWAVNDKDLTVTDNGDGTLTLLVLRTGNEQWYDADGKLLFANTGQVRFEVLIDHGGTPTDPSDDVFLDDLGVVKDSTGRNDLEGRGFCEDFHMVTG